MFKKVNIIKWGMTVSKIKDKISQILSIRMIRLWSLSTLMQLKPFNRSREWWEQMKQWSWISNWSWRSINLKSCQLQKYQRMNHLNQGNLLSLGDLVFPIYLKQRKGKKLQTKKLKIKILNIMGIEKQNKLISLIRLMKNIKTWYPILPRIVKRRV